MFTDIYFLERRIVESIMKLPQLEEVGMKKFLYVMFFSLCAMQVGAYSQGSEVRAEAKGKQTPVKDSGAVVSKIPQKQVKAPDSISAQTAQKIDAAAVNKAGGTSDSSKNVVSNDSATTQTPVARSNDSTIKPVDTARVKVIITSVPESAVVVFDDMPKGKTPVEIGDVSKGVHTVILKKSGYFLKKATIDVAGGKDVPVNFELVKPARLVITSEPVGASVLIDTINAGNTPYKDDKFKPGQYSIQVMMDGYETWQKSVTVQSGGADSINCALNRTKATGSESRQAGKKERSRSAKIFDRIALGVFLGFSLIILIVELAQDR